MGRHLDNPYLVSPVGVVADVAESDADADADATYAYAVDAVDDLRGRLLANSLDNPFLVS